MGTKTIRITVKANSVEIDDREYYKGHVGSFYPSLKLATLLETGEVEEYLPDQTDLF